MATIRNITNIRHARKKLTEILRDLEDDKIAENKAKTMTYILRTIMDALVIESNQEIDKNSTNGATSTLKEIISKVIN